MRLCEVQAVTYQDPGLAECKATGCKRRKPRRFDFCSDHWLSLPLHLRAGLTVAHRDLFHIRPILRDVIEQQIIDYVAVAVEFLDRHIYERGLRIEVMVNEDLFARGGADDTGLSWLGWFNEGDRIRYQEWRVPIPIDGLYEVIVSGHGTPSAQMRTYRVDGS